MVILVENAFKTSSWSCLFLTFLLYINHKIVDSSVQTQRVVIVGGGPTGLSAALTLEKRGYKDIHVLERGDLNAAETDRSYQFLINGRGQRLTDHLELTDLLSSGGVPSSQFRNVTVLEANGNLVTKAIPVLQEDSTENYWIPRVALMRILQGSIKGSESIKVHYNVECSDIIMSTENRGDVITVQGRRVGKNTTGALSPLNNVRRWEADLVIGCDGINSKVRSTRCYHSNQGLL